MDLPVAEFRLRGAHPFVMQLSDPGSSMALGSIIRQLLGPHLARAVGRCYRSIYVDLKMEGLALAGAIPLNAHLLDIGGGDGEPLNYLLEWRPDLRITTIDPGHAVGGWIEARFEGRVTRRPQTRLVDYLQEGLADPDAILIADVMHHIPKDARDQFLRPLASLLNRVPHVRIVVKDVEPGFLRSTLGYLSDRFITGDRNVSPISKEKLAQLFQEVLGPLQRIDTDLFEHDKPNYMVIFFR